MTGFRGASKEVINVMRGPFARRSSWGLFWISRSFTYYSIQNEVALGAF